MEFAVTSLCFDVFCHSATPLCRKSEALSQCVTAWATPWRRIWSFTLVQKFSQVSQQFQGEPVSVAAVAMTALVSFHCAMCHETWQPKKPKDSMQPAFSQKSSSTSFHVVSSFQSGATYIYIYLWARTKLLPQRRSDSAAYACQLQLVALRVADALQMSARTFPTRTQNEMNQAEQDQCKKGDTIIATATTRVAGLATNFGRPVVTVVWDCFAFHFRSCDCIESVDAANGILDNEKLHTAQFLSLLCVIRAAPPQTLRRRASQIHIKSHVGPKQNTCGDPRTCSLALMRLCSSLMPKLQRAFLRELRTYLQRIKTVAWHHVGRNVGVAP